MILQCRFMQSEYHGDKCHAHPEDPHYSPVHSPKPSARGAIIFFNFSSFPDNLKRPTVTPARGGTLPAGTFSVCFFRAHCYFEWVTHVLGRIKVGADAPLPPNTMNDDAPDGAPPRRF